MRTIESMPRVKDANLDPCSRCAASMLGRSLDVHHDNPKPRVMYRQDDSALHLISRLVRQRQRLRLSYVIHVVWFAAMVISAALQVSKTGVAVSVLLALVTVPPVIASATAVHRTCRALDPRCATIGLVPMLVMTVLFSPFESGLVVPAKNLIASGRLLRRLQDRVP